MECAWVELESAKREWEQLERQLLAESKAAALQTAKNEIDSIHSALTTSLSPLDPEYNNTTMLAWMGTLQPIKRCSQWRRG